jgi:hypothetical protein
MTAQALILGDAVGAALLAAWLSVRFASRTPRTAVTMLHAALVYLVMAVMPGSAHLVAGTGDVAVRKLASNFLVIVPGFTYIWLASIWMLLLVKRGAHTHY